jgi:hypothetical protein
MGKSGEKGGARRGANKASGQTSSKSSQFIARMQQWDRRVDASIQKMRRARQRAS